MDKQGDNKRGDSMLYGIWIALLVMIAVAMLAADFEQDMALAMLAIGYSGVTIRILGTRERQRHHNETIRLLRRIAGVEDE